MTTDGKLVKTGRIFRRKSGGESVAVVLRVPVVDRRIFSFRRPPLRPRLSSSWIVDRMWFTRVADPFHRVRKRVLGNACPDAWANASASPAASGESWPSKASLLIVTSNSIGRLAFAPLRRCERWLDHDSFQHFQIAPARSAAKPWATRRQCMSSSACVVVRLPAGRHVDVEPAVDQPRERPGEVAAQHIHRQIPARSTAFLARRRRTLAVATVNGWPSTRPRHVERNSMSNAAQVLRKSAIWSDSISTGTLTSCGGREWSATASDTLLPSALRS